MKFHWLRRLLEKVPPGVSINLPVVSIDPGSLAQYFADEDSTHKDEILAELANLRKDVGGGFQDLKSDLETRGIDTQEKFDELLIVILRIYANSKLLNDVVLPPNYDDYLKFLIKDLSEWQKRYAPMFAKFKSLTLFARVTQKPNKLAPQELIELIRKNKRLVIIGPAGSGKTTTLKKVALNNASNCIKQKPHSYLPILAPLRDYGSVNLKELINSIIKPWGITPENIEQDLVKGKFLVIFDGLNEVPSKFRQQCFQEIRSFSREYRFNRFLYTSRSFEYQDDWISTDDEISIPVCEIESLTKGQIEDCIRRYFGTRNKLADQLIDQLKIHDSRVWENSKSLARLASTPLLLQMLILTFEEKRRIPKSEGELLLGFVDEILLKIEPKKSAAEINPEVKKALLATIAWKMYQEELSSIDKRYAFSVFLKRLDELKRSGIATISYDSNQIWQELQNNYLIIDNGNLVYWPHPLYQELFTGLSLRETCFEDNWEPKFAEIYVQFHSIEAKWYGNPSFEAGLRMLEVIPQPHRLNGLTVIAMINPSLAKEALLRFEPEHNPGMMDEFSETLKRDLLSSKWEGECHRNLLMTASYIPDDWFCSLFNDCATLCPTWEGREQSAIFLWSRCEKSIALEVLKKLCETDLEARVRKTAFNILIQSEEKLDEEMCSFLAQRLFEENQGFLSDPQLLLQKLFDSEIIVALLVDLAKKENNRNEKLRAIWCLGESKTNNVMARKTLIELARKVIDEEIRGESVNALATYPSDLTIKVLCGLANNDQAKPVRINAINSLYAMGSVKVIPSIVSALDDNENDVVEKAMATLVDLSKKEKRVVSTLLRNLKQAEFRSKILQTLSRITIGETDPQIQAKICKEIRYYENERDKYVRLEMALALRGYDLTLSNEIMRELSNDKDQTIRESAQEILNEWGIEL